MLEIVFLFFQLLFAVYLTYYCISFVLGAPYVPSSKKAAQAMIRMAHMKPKMRIYDLGSGDGKLLMMAAQGGALAVGYEINPLLVCLTYIKILVSGQYRHITIKWKNFWNADISNADIIYVYLIPWKMQKLQQKLLKEAKPGAKIISNSFIFPNLSCTGQDTQNHIYEFTLPKKRV